MNAVVAFDMDGTLIDSAGDIGAAVNRMRVSFGLAPLPRESVVRICDHHSETVFLCKFTHYVHL